jgi:hypothetical protein
MTFRENPYASPRGPAGSDRAAGGEKSSRIAPSLAMSSAGIACFWFASTCIVVGVHLRGSQGFAIPDVASAVALSLWCGAPHLASGVLSALCHRFLGPTLVFFAASLLLGATSMWMLWGTLEQPPPAPEVMNCGPPLLLIWTVAHWIGVGASAALAAAVFGAGSLRRSFQGRSRGK